MQEDGHSAHTAHTAHVQHFLDLNRAQLIAVYFLTNSKLPWIQREYYGSTLYALLIPRLRSEIASQPL